MTRDNRRASDAFDALRALSHADGAGQAGQTAPCPRREVAFGRMWDRIEEAVDEALLDIAAPEARESASALLERIRAEHRGEDRA